MVGPSRQGLPAWMGAAAIIELDGTSASNSPSSSSQSPSSCSSSRPSSTDPGIGVRERMLSAAGAAVLSAVLVNPLDVAKTRLQAQAAGVPYSPAHHHQAARRMVSLGPSELFSDFRCSPTCSRSGLLGAELVCPPDCFQYKGTLDVFNKVVRQEGLGRLWRGTSAALALAVPSVGIYLPCYDIFLRHIEAFTNQNAPKFTPYAPLIAGTAARSLACIACSPIELARTRMQAFKEYRNGAKPPGVWKTLVGVLSPIAGANNLQILQTYRALWIGLGAQLARDVPFSAICWSTLEPLRRRILNLIGDNVNTSTVFGANFAAGFVAGSLAASATCPLDVAKTRRQIEKDPLKVLNMTTRSTLIEIWRDGGFRGLFMGAGPRVARAGPSVGMVVSFYELVKYVLHQRQATIL